MKVEKEPIRKQTMFLLVMISFTLLTTLVFYSLFHREVRLTDWKMEVVSLSDRVSAGQVSDIQLFLYDDDEKPVTAAAVTLTLDQPGAPHLLETNMKHMEDGLYTAEIILPAGGTWIGWVEATQKSGRFIDQFIFQASGYLLPTNEDDWQKFYYFEPKTASVHGRG